MKVKLTKKERNRIHTLANYGEVRNSYTGSGSRTKRGPDEAHITELALRTLGMKEGVHFVIENDAPHGGWTGKHIKLTAKGRRWKVIRDAIDKPVPEPAEEKKTGNPDRDLSSFEGEALLTEFFKAEFHPAPAEVLQAKTKSGLSWAALRSLYKITV